MAEIQDLLAHVATLQKENADACLFTLLKTTGSTFRKASARMLVDSKERSSGVLTPGCLDHFFMQSAADILTSSNPALLNIDQSDFHVSYLKSGSGCQGGLVVLAECLKSVAVDIHPAVPQAATLLPAALLGIGPQPLAHGVAAHLDSAGALTARHFIAPDEKTLQQMMSTPSPASNSYFLLEHLRTPLRILILGASPVAAEFAKIADVLGWQTLIADPRESWLEKLRMPASAERVQVGAEHLTQALASRNFIPDALLLMTHHFDWDRAFLRACSSMQVRYLGLLGTAARWQHLLTALGPEISPAEKLHLETTVRCPAGLKTSSYSPETIALSLAAEVQLTLG